MTDVSSSPTPNNSFAKSMESKMKRLIHTTKHDAPLSQRKGKRSLQERSKCEQRGTVKSSSIPSPSSTFPHCNRLVGERTYEDGAEKTNNNRNSWRSPIGTIADHRMTNNNRIREQWRLFAVISTSLILCLVQATVVNGHPDPVPTPIRVSHSYTKTVSNSIPTSTTSRSTTQLTSFLPSDAISPHSTSFLNYNNYNTFANNRSSSNTASSFSSSIFSSFTPKKVNSAASYSKASSSNAHKNNANVQTSSRRVASSKASRKDITSPVTSIDRPFYTKLTSNDAVASPSYYKRNKSSATKKTKKSKTSSKSPSSYGKYPKAKGSKEHGSSSSSSVEEMGNDDYGFMPPHTTEKSYHPPKLSLEPFFNFLTSLATASREVIMSKEQQQPHHHNNHHHHHHQQTEQSAIATGASKYTSSYETINQSIREVSHKSKKSKKGSKSKKKGKAHSKGSKKGSKGGSKRHRTKSIESLSVEDEEIYELDGTDGPVSVPLPKEIIDSTEEKENVDDDNDNSDPDVMESPGGLHILDVLRTPMVPDYESPSPAFRAEPLVGFDYSEGGSTTSTKSKSVASASLKNASANSTSLSSNPPSGRANLNNKGQGYIAFDSYDGPGSKNVSSSISVSTQKKPHREKQQRNERDPMEQSAGGGPDLTAQESMSHAQVVPNPFGMKPDTGGGGLAPQYQYPTKSNNNNNNNNEHSYATTSSQQVSLSQAEYTGGKSAASSSESSGYRQQQAPTNGNNEFVSKYPTTFVYQPNSVAGPPPPPGTRQYLNPSSPGFPPNNNVIYGSPSPPPPQQMHSSPPFRMNKLRPNLHSYYDSTYHNYAGEGESQQLASEMIGVRQPFGPPHFQPPPPHSMMHRPPPLPSPPRFGNGYGNRPGFMGMPHRGTHYVGHTLNNAAPPAQSSREPITNPYDDPNTDYQQDNGNINNSENSSVGNQDISGADVTGGSSDNIEQYPVSEIDDNSVTAAENSETKKVGIMESFDLFYKEYKILAWVAIFFCTSMALLSLLVFMYINNPPTEVVQARQLFPWNDLLKNPQITRFLSNLIDSSRGSRRRKKDDPIDNDYDEMGYLKPYGKGFGVSTGRQTRKKWRSQQNKTKFVRRVNKIKRVNEMGRSDNNDDTITPHPPGKQQRQ